MSDNTNSSSNGSDAAPEKIGFEIENQAMDIHSKPGTWVRFSYPDAGMQGHQERAKEYLEEGRVYSVEKTEVKSFHAHVYLNAFPGVSFNSVLFAPTSAEELADIQMPDEKENPTMDTPSKPGTKVIFMYPDAGLDSDIAVATRYLTVGQTYEVVATMIDSGRTMVCLAGLAFAGVSFNIVHFAPYSEVQEKHKVQLDTAPGTRLVYVSGREPGVGYDLKAELHLEPGKGYTLDKSFNEGYSIGLYLIEVPHITFSTAQFDIIAGPLEETADDDASSGLPDFEVTTGLRVTFTDPKASNEIFEIRAAAHLVVGEVYTVARVAVQTWAVEITLKEGSAGMWFDACQFAPHIEAPEESSDTEIGAAGGEYNVVERRLTLIVNDVAPEEATKVMRLVNNRDSYSDPLAPMGYDSEYTRIKNGDENELDWFKCAAAVDTGVTYAYKSSSTGETRSSMPIWHVVTDFYEDETPVLAAGAPNWPMGKEAAELIAASMREYANRNII